MPAREDLTAARRLDHKRTDLITARSLAGWTQAEAARVMGVSLRGYKSWELGERNIPPTKFSKFLSLAGLNREQLQKYMAHLPKALVYDADGFPAPYTRKQWAADAEGVIDEALEALEGADYPARERAREVIRVTPIYGDNLEGLKEYMARYDDSHLV